MPRVDDLCCSVQNLLKSREGHRCKRHVRRSEMAGEENSVASIVFGVDADGSQVVGKRWRSRCAAPVLDSWCTHHVLEFGSGGTSAACPPTRVMQTPLAAARKSLDHAQP